MPKNAAIKNAARARQAETGESYTDARAAVVAEHDEPIMIQLWQSETVLGFELDRPESRKAWRELDLDDSDAVLAFAHEHLGDAPAGLLMSELEYAYVGDGGMVLVEEPSTPDYPGNGYAEVAEWVSKDTGTTVTPEQVGYLVERYGIPDDDDDCGLDLPMLIKVLPSLPVELSTTALLTQYASTLAEVDLTAIRPDEEIPNMRISPSRWLLTSAIRGGFADGTPLDRRPITWPVEVHKIQDIMECATEANDAQVLHQCVDILATWMHKLADHAAGGPAMSHRLADGSWT